MTTPGESWVREAVAGGARPDGGCRPSEAAFAPTVLTGVPDPGGALARRP